MRQAALVGRNNGRAVGPAPPCGTVVPRPRRRRFRRHPPRPARAPWHLAAHRRQSGPHRNDLGGTDLRTAVQVLRTLEFGAELHHRAQAKPSNRLSGFGAVRPKSRLYETPRLPRPLGRPRLSHYRAGSTDAGTGASDSLRNPTSLPRAVNRRTCDPRQEWHCAL